MRTRTVGQILALVAALAACEGGPAEPGQANSVVVGKIDDGGGTSPSLSPSAQPPAEPSAPSPQLQGSAETVVIGQVSSGGTFTAFAEAEVDAGGNFRIEGVPSGRTDLLIRARNSAGAEIGSVVLHERTEAETEHTSHPINARSTVHARTWVEMRSENSPSAMGSAELALFLRFQSEAEAEAAMGPTEIRAIAEAAVEAQTTIGAVLASQGHSMTAAARSTLLAEVAAARDQQRSIGVAVETAHETYVEAAVGAFLDAGVSAEAVVTAYAAGVTAFYRSIEASSASATTQVNVVRDALLLTVYARASAAASESGLTLGLRSATITTMAQMEAGLEAAVSIAEIRATIEEERAEIEDRAVNLVASALLTLGGSATAEIEAELRSALVNANLWSDLEGSASASTAVQAVADFRSRVDGEVDAFVASLPTEIRALLSASVLFRMMVCLGAGASVA